MSLIFWSNSRQFLKKNYSLALITIIVLVDLWNIDMKYVNEDNFSNSSKVKTPFNQNQIDIIKLQKNAIKLLTYSQVL